MTVTEFPVGFPDDESSLELLTDGDVWTLVPVDATGDERMTRWISVDTDTVCDLRDWR